MVINCYLAIVSYSGITVKALEDNLKEMCQLPRNHIPEENFFFDFEAFYEVQMHGGKTIFEGIYDIQDKQFINQVFWAEQEKLHSYNNYDTTDGIFNCFWGCFSKKKKEYEFSKAADYFCYRLESIKESLTQMTFWRFKHYVYPFLVFADSVQRLIREQKDESFSIISKGLECLDKISSQWKKNDEFDIVAELSKLRLSGESESTRNDDRLMKMRDFDFGELGVFRCEKHLKLSEFLRIHIYPDYTTRSIFIGYAGPHLPTSSVKH